MAGVQGSRLAIAVTNAGGLGSLPAALLREDVLRHELPAIRDSTTRPFNVHFFCHKTPVEHAARDMNWKQVLAPYYKDFGLSLNEIPAANANTLRRGIG